MTMPANTSRVTGPHNTAAECTDRVCTYYVHYLARGAAALNHEDYHLKERFQVTLHGALVDAGTEEWRRVGIQRQIDRVEEEIRV